MNDLVFKQLFDAFRVRGGGVLNPSFEDGSCFLYGTVIGQGDLRIMLETPVVDRPRGTEGLPWATLRVTKDEVCLLEITYESPAVSGSSDAVVEVRLGRDTGGVFNPLIPGGMVIVMIINRLNELVQFHSPHPHSLVAV